MANNRQTDRGLNLISIDYYYCCLFDSVVFTAVSPLPVQSSDIPAETIRIFRKSGWACHVFMPGLYKVLSIGFSHVVYKLTDGIVNK